MTDNTIKAPFTVGSITKHVSKATAAGTAGLIAIFAVDFLNLFYIAQLGKQELTAAIGFTSLVMFLQTSLALGFMIGAGALVGRAVGKGDRAEAERLISSSFFLTTVAMIVLTLIMMVTIPFMLEVMGAEGEASRAAARFLYITTPLTIFIGYGIVSSGILRSLGDVRRSSLVTLAGAIITAIVDPILIFYFKLGLDGAAIATNISRIVFCGFGLYWVFSHHKIDFKLDFTKLSDDCKALLKVAVPALLTNIATPIGLGIATGYIARFGEGAIAGFTIINRLVPMAFCVYFTLSGAVGSVIAQNYGAKLFSRVQETMKISLFIVTGYGIFIWIVLAIFATPLAGLFDAKGEALSITVFFCQVVAVAWIFNGGQFVANAAFNNLGYPMTSTLFNWGRATIGNLPFMYLFVAFAGSLGLSELQAAVLGQGVGGIVFATFGMWWCWRLVKGLK